MKMNPKIILTTNRESISDNYAILGRDGSVINATKSGNFLIENLYLVLENTGKGTVRDIQDNGYYEFCVHFNGCKYYQYYTKYQLDILKSILKELDRGYKTVKICYEKDYCYSFACDKCPQSAECSLRFEGELSPQPELINIIKEIANG